MDPIYLAPIQAINPAEAWGANSSEDEAFFNALSDDRQKAILADCTSSEQFHEKVRIARLCN